LWQLLQKQWWYWNVVGHAACWQRLGSRGALVASACGEDTISNLKTLSNRVRIENFKVYGDAILASLALGMESSHRAAKAVAAAAAATVVVVVPAACKDAVVVLHERVGHLEATGA
jgi:hypothetical protein